VTALLVNLLLAQLLLVGTGTPCAAPASMAGAHGAMSSERMAPAPAPAPAAGESSQRPSDCGAGDDRAPCTAPSMPSGTGCVQMSTCAAPMMVELPAALLASPGAARAVAAPATAPFGVAPAPDVPPPRA
jgi:hypothetical protein